MRIATFNLENLDSGPDAAVPIEDRLKVLVPQIARLDADILCLQEVNAQKPAGDSVRQFLALDRLAAEAGLSGFHRAVSSNRAGTGPVDRHNLATLSRFPIEDSAQLWHDLVPEPRYRYVTADPTPEEAAALAWDRPVLRTRIRLPGGAALELFNVHLRAPLACPVPGQKEDAATWRTIVGWAEGYYLSEIKRAGQAFELRMAVDSVFDAEAEALICIAGDYNAGEHHTPVQILRGDADNTGNGALAPRMMIPVEHRLPEQRRFTVIHQGRRQMFDHVLVSRPLLGRLHGSDIHNEALADELVAAASVTASPESYHAPVVAEFDL